MKVSKRLVRTGFCGVVVMLALLVLFPGAVLAAYDLTVEPISHLNGCVYRNEFQRGDQAIWLITIKDPATGQPIGEGIDVSVSIGDKDVKANYNAKTFLWAAPLAMTWDYPTGSSKFSVVIKSADGGMTVWRPTYAANQEIVVKPGPVAVAAQILDPVSGAAVESFSPGATVSIVAQTKRPLKAEDWFVPAKPDRELTLKDKDTLVTEGRVNALVGQGSFVAARGEFTGGTLSDVDLKYDAAREAWTGSYTFPTDAGEGAYSLAVIAEDAYGNRGTILAGTANLTIPPVEPGPLDGPKGLYLGVGIAVVGLGVGVGMAAKGSRRKSNIV